ncbi:MAG: VC0807 family protein [Terriglobales bacterium]
MSTADASPVPQAVAPADDTSHILRGIISSVAWNAIVPVLLYAAARKWLHTSEFRALVISTLYPVAEGIWGLAWERQMDPIAGVVLFGIVVNLGAISVGGSPRLLLLRESYATGAIGIACFLSLALPRPLMFYFGRYFFGGRDPVKRAGYDQSWAFPDVRRGNRLVTLVWGVVFTGELGVQVVLVFMLPAAAVLVLSPLILGVCTVATIIWTLRYASRVRQQVAPRLSAAAHAS